MLQLPHDAADGKAFSLGAGVESILIIHAKLCLAALASLTARRAPTIGIRQTTGQTGKVAKQRV